MAEEADVPIYDKEKLCAFLQNTARQGTRFPELLPTRPKFLIHVPHLDDGGGMIRFANVKEADIKYQEGKTSLELKRYESLPQHVATNGTGWIVVNSSDEFNAIKWRSHLAEILSRNGGKVDRAVIQDLLRFIQGFTVGFKNEGGREVVDTANIHVNPNSVVGFAFDVYSMPQRDKDLKYESVPHIGEAAEMLAGLFYKKPEAYKTFFIKGHFKVEYIRGDSWHQVQEYKNGAFITIDPRGEISSIDPTNMDSSYGFLKKDVQFSDVRPGIDRACYITPVSQGLGRIPKFTVNGVNLVLNQIALAERGLPTADASRRAQG